MKTKNFLVIAVIIVTAIAAISVKSCIDKKKPPVISPTKQTKDSVDKNEAQSKIIIDSLKTIEARITREKDSLKLAAERSASLLNIRTLKLTVLSKEYALYRQYADTANALRACDSLSNQVVSLTQEVDQATKDNRALQNSYDSLLSNNSLRIGRLEFDKSFLQEKFDHIAGNCQQLEKENAALKKKVKRRISVGSGGGGTLIGGKPRAVVEIVSIHYSWFKL